MKNKLLAISAVGLFALVGLGFSKGTAQASLEENIPEERMEIEDYDQKRPMDRDYQDEYYYGHHRRGHGHMGREYGHHRRGYDHMERGYGHHRGYRNNRSNSPHCGNFY